MLDVLPDHDVFEAGGCGTSYREEKPTIESDFEEAQDFTTGGVFRQITQAWEANSKERSARVGVVGSLSAGSDAEIKESW